MASGAKSAAGHERPSGRRSGAPAADPSRVAAIVKSLGGESLLGPVDGPLGVHDLIRAGLPSAAVQHFVSSFRTVPAPEVARAMGVSLRTVQRLKKRLATDRLGTDQSDRAWQLAEVLARATDVFGTREDAERWLEAPAIGLDQRRPIDLLGTSAGTEAVKTYLERIDHGIYA